MMDRESLVLGRLGERGPENVQNFSGGCYRQAEQLYYYPSADKFGGVNPEADSPYFLR